MIFAAFFQRTMGILDLEHCWLLLSFVVSAYHTANRTVAPLAATCPVTGSAGAQCPAKGKPTEALRSSARRLEIANKLRWYPQQPQRFIFTNLSEACWEAKRWKLSADFP